VNIDTGKNAASKATLLKKEKGSSFAGDSPWQV